MAISIPDKDYIAFVASGGGAKAWFFHVGACLALEERGFLFDGGLIGEPPMRKGKFLCDRYVGSSGGAIFAALTASGFSPQQQADTYTRTWISHLLRRMANRTADYPRPLRKLSYWDGISFNRRFFGDFFRGWRHIDRLKYGGIDSLLYYLLSFGTPLSSHGIARFMNKELPTDEFSALRVDCNIVATLNDPTPQLARIIFGKERRDDPGMRVAYRDSVPISTAVAASCALTGLFAPVTVEIEGRQYDLIDGEIHKTLSTHVARDKIILDKERDGNPDAEGLILASYTHQPYPCNERYGPLRKFGLLLNIQQAIYIAVASRIDLAQELHEVKTIVDEEIVNFCRDQEIPEEAWQKMRQRLHRRIGYDPKIDYLFIHPRRDDAEFFLAGNHFDLTTGLRRVVEKGYEAGLAALRKCDFRRLRPVRGEAASGVCTTVAS
ncbi:MAG: hypothetical protein D6812_07010 [Deltaproteobacteria bacterium]|nr:MAG: hypothetical protein D6812_07010 [Deltaproteobacteria bacterium]